MMMVGYAGITHLVKPVTTDNMLYLVHRYKAIGHKTQSLFTEYRIKSGRSFNRYRISY